MTIAVTTVANTQSFGAWLSTTNRIANIVSQNTVTVDLSTGGSLSTGNGYVNGYFGANYVYVANGISGGNVSSNGVLYIVSNAAFTNATSNVFSITSNSTQSITNINTSNVTITTNEVTANVTKITVGNSSVNAVINSTSYNIGTSFVANTSRLVIGTAIGLQANGSIGTAGQILTSNGTTVYWGPVGATGTVSTVITGNGLTGGPITTSGTVSILANTGLVANSTGAFVNASYIATISANSATYLGAAGNLGNASGIYTSGVVNAATFSVGTVFVANSSGIDITTGSYKSDAVAVSALDIDCRTGNYFTKTIATNSTFTFSNPPSGTKAYSFTIEVTHTSGTITWPTTVRWPANTAPTLTTGKTHLFMFITDDAGTRWRGSSLINYDA